MPLVPPPGPLRVMATATLVNTFGNGLFMTASALFYTRSVGLSPQQVGVGLTIAGLAGLLVGVPVGHLADLRGARDLLRVLNVLQALAMSSLLLVHSFAGFLLASTFYVMTDRASNAVRQGLIAVVFAPEERVQGRAYLRAVTNFGISLGAVLAGVALSIGTREAFASLVLGDVVTYLLVAVLLGRLPKTPPRVVHQQGSTLVALKDRPFVVVTALSGVMGMHYVLLDVAVPIWVDQHTEAPRWTVALVFLVNTVCCVLFQVRTARGAVDVRSSARSNRTGGFLLAASCLVFAASDGLGAGAAVVVLVVAALVNVAGELFQAAGSWGIGFGLSPEDRQGQYQGLYTTGFAAATMLGPLVVTSTAIALGPVGWVLLAVLLGGVGIVLVPVTAWAERTRVAV